MALVDGLEKSIIQNTNDIFDHAANVIGTDIYDLNKEDYTGYQFVACLDFLTCPICAGYDGNIYFDLPTQRLEAEFEGIKVIGTYKELKKLMATEVDALTYERALKTIKYYDQKIATDKNLTEATKKAYASFQKSLQALADKYKGDKTIGATPAGATIKQENVAPTPIDKSLKQTEQEVKPGNYTDFISNAKIIVDVNELKRLGYKPSELKKLSEGEIQNQLMAIYKKLPQELQALFSTTGIKKFNLAKQSAYLSGEDTIDLAVSTVLGMGQKSLQETLVHELGHALDDKLKGSSNKYFQTMIEADYAKVLEHYARGLQIGTNFIKADGSIDLFAKDYKALIKKLNEEQILFSSDLNMNVSLKGLLAYSDVINGLSDGEIEGLGGHSQSYWNSGTSKAYKESFAHFIEALSSKDVFNAFSNNFPNTMKVFNDLIKDGLINNQFMQDVAPVSGDLIKALKQYNSVVKEYEVKIDYNKAESYVHKYSIPLVDSRPKYTSNELNIISSYTSSAYVGWNSDIAKGNIPPDAKILNEVLNKAKMPVDIVTKRVTEAKYHFDWKVGEDYSWTILTSSSLRNDFTGVDIFEDDPNAIIIKIIAPKDTSGLYVGVKYFNTEAEARAAGKSHDRNTALSSHPFEDEVLLPFGQKVRVLEKGVNSAGIATMTVMLLN